MRALAQRLSAAEEARAGLSTAVQQLSTDVTVLVSRGQGGGHGGGSTPRGLPPAHEKVLACCKSGSC
jgi:hypothetical protein